MAKLIRTIWSWIRFRVSGTVKLVDRDIAGVKADAQEFDKFIDEHIPKPGKK